MPIPPEAVRLWNVAHARLGLSDARIAELAGELDHLRDAAEAVRPALSFDTEPSDFRAALLELGRGVRP